MVSSIQQYSCTLYSLNVIGVTIAVDIAVTFVFFIVWYGICVLVRGTNVTGTNAPAAPQSLRDPVANSPPSGNEKVSGSNPAYGWLSTGDHGTAI